MSDKLSKISLQTNVKWHNFHSVLLLIIPTNCESSGNVKYLDSGPIKMELPFYKGVP